MIEVGSVFSKARERFRSRLIAHSADYGTERFTYYSQPLDGSSTALQKTIDEVVDGKGTGIPVIVLADGTIGWTPTVKIEHKNLHRAINPSVSSAAKIDIIGRDQSPVSVDVYCDDMTVLGKIKGYLSRSLRPGININIHNDRAVLLESLVTTGAENQFVQNQTA